MRWHGSRPSTGEARPVSDAPALSRSRKAGVYAYALDWHKLGLLALAGAAAAKYVDPVLLAAVLPAAVKQVFTNLIHGAVAVRQVGLEALVAAKRAELERMANEGAERREGEGD